jgi:hypothetical protein
MTDFAAIQPTAPATATAPQLSEDTPKATLGSDFETFLKMLTTQMKNQDPLNPVESSEYAVQLATFSSVEQQVLTNDLLTRLIGQSHRAGFGLGRDGSAGSRIGRFRRLADRRLGRARAGRRPGLRRGAR